MKEIKLDKLFTQSKISKRSKRIIIECSMCGKKIYKHKGNQKYCTICKSEAVINNLKKMGQVNF